MDQSRVAEHNGAAAVIGRGQPQPPGIDFGRAGISVGAAQGEQAQSELGQTAIGAATGAVEQSCRDSRAEARGIENRAARHDVGRDATGDEIRIAVP